MQRRAMSFMGDTPMTYAAAVVKKQFNASGMQEAGNNRVRSLFLIIYFFPQPVTDFTPA